ncbi:MAG: hypothetical protein ACJAZN_000521 [Planctomycetota bacterium]|jgi:uncharacterized protein (DUF1501 family)
MGLAAGAAAATCTPRIGFAASPGSGPQRDVLISVFCRGGMDGLSAVVPFGDPDYAVERGALAVPPPSAGQGAEDLDGFFGLSPAAAPLKTPYLDGRLLVVHAAGSPYQTLSHFEGMKRWETGTPLSGSVPLLDGWAARHLKTIAPLGTGEFRAASITALLPPTLTGGPGAIPIAVPPTYAFPGEAATASARRGVIDDLYRGSSSAMAPAAVSALSALDALQNVSFQSYTPANGAVYPGSPFGSSLRSVAAMLKAGLDLEVCEVDFDAWDHHTELGPLNGKFAGMIDTFARSLEAFYLDLSNSGVRYTLVAHSEFGRRIAPNLSGGCDHGHGNAMYVMGDQINGGRVLTQWPGLSPANQVDGNLGVTIDYRDILAEIAERRLGSTELDALFPDHVRTVHGVTL